MYRPMRQNKPRRVIHDVAELPVLCDCAEAGLLLRRNPEVIAKMAKEKKVGARALRAIIEDFMLDIMYEIPKDDNIGTVTITKDYVEKKGGPLIQMRGTPELADSQHV